MEAFKLIIQEPCHENWNKMSPNEKGRFCAVCDKTVIDFTHKSPLEIKQHIDKSEGKVCGRVNSRVLEKTIVPQAAGINFNGRHKWWTWISILALLGFTRKMATMEMPSKDKNINPEAKKLSIKSSKTLVRGTVRNSETQEGIEAVEIKIYSAGELIGKTQSYVNGAFEMELPIGVIKQNKINLEFKHLNYDLTQLNEIPVEKNELLLDAQLNPLQTELHQLIQPVQMELTLGGIQYESYDYVTPEIEVKPDNWHTMGAVAYRELEIMETVRTEIKEEPIQQENLPVETMEFSLKTFPNPTADVITVEFEHAVQVSLQVFDLSGKLMHSFTTNQTQNTISLGDFPNGTYIVRAIDDATHKVITKKVVKVR